MKFQATSWPVTITYEIADDWLEGIDPENINEITSDHFDSLQEAAEESADLFIKAKGFILAQQEAKRKQTAQNNGTKS